MAVLWQNSFDSATRSDGDDLTTANSGDTGNGDAMTVTVGTGSTVKHSASNSRFGFGARISIPGTGALATWIGKTDLTARTAETWFRFYVRKEFAASSMVGTWFDLFRVVASDGSSRCAVLRLSTGDIVDGRDAADASAAASTNSVAMGTGLVRFEVRVLPGTTGGQLEWWMYKTDPQGAVGTHDDTGVNNSAALAASTAGFRAGVVATPTNLAGLSFAYDDIVIADSGPIGPATTVPQLFLPDADLATTGWTTTPLFSKLNDSSDSTVVSGTAA